MRCFKVHDVVRVPLEINAEVAEIDRRVDYEGEGEAIASIETESDLVLIVLEGNTLVIYKSKLCDESECEEGEKE